MDIKKLARIERIGHRIHGDRSRSVELIRTRPYPPRTNGKAERFIQTCKRVT